MYRATERWSDGAGVWCVSARKDRCQVVTVSVRVGDTDGGLVRKRGACIDEDIDGVSSRRCGRSRTVGSLVRVGDGCLLVREQRDCLVEAVAWYEASVVGRQGQATQQYYL